MKGFVKIKLTENENIIRDLEGNNVVTDNFKKIAEYVLQNRIYNFNRDLNPFSGSSLVQVPNLAMQNFCNRIALYDQIQIIDKSTEIILGNELYSSSITFFNDIANKKYSFTLTIPTGQEILNINSLSLHPTNPPGLNNFSLFEDTNITYFSGYGDEYTGYIRIDPINGIYLRNLGGSEGFRFFKLKKEVRMFKSDSMKKLNFALNFPIDNVTSYYSMKGQKVLVHNRLTKRIALFDLENLVKEFDINYVTDSVLRGKSQGALIGNLFYFKYTNSLNQKFLYILDIETQSLNNIEIQSGELLYDKEIFANYNEKFMILSDNVPVGQIETFQYIMDGNLNIFKRKQNEVDILSGNNNIFYHYWTTFVNNAFTKYKLSEIYVKESMPFSIFNLPETVDKLSNQQLIINYEFTYN